MKFTVPWLDVLVLALPFIFILVAVLLVGELRPVGVLIVLPWAMYYAMKIGWRIGAEWAAGEAKKIVNDELGRKP